MSKSAKKQTVISSATTGPAARPAGKTAAESVSKKAEPGSKQSRVIAMLRSLTGATIGAMMKATGWQQLSFPKISSGPDSCREAESSHHSGRCFRGGQTVSRVRQFLARQRSGRRRKGGIRAAARALGLTRHRLRPHHRGLYNAYPADQPSCPHP